MVQRKSGTSSQSPLLHSHGMPRFLQLSHNTKYRPPGKLKGDLRAQGFFPWGRSQKYLCLTGPQSPDCQKESHQSALSSLCARSPGAGSHSYRLGKVLCQIRSCFPASSQMPTFLRWPLRPTTLALSCQSLLYCPPVGPASNPSRPPGGHLSATQSFLLSLSFT